MITLFPAMLAMHRSVSLSAIVVFAVLPAICRGDTKADFSAAYKNAEDLWAKGKIRDALSPYGRAAELAIQVFGAKHADTANIYSNYRLYVSKDNYAQTLLEMGQHSRAQVLLEECYSAFKKNMPKDHPDIATCSANLGFAYRSQHRPEKAIPFYMECLDIQQRRLPGNHPGLAQTHNNLGVAFQDLNRISEARHHLQKSLEIRRECFDEKSPYLAMSLNDLALLEQSDGKHELSAALFEEALRIHASSPGEQQLNSAMVTQNYARLLSAQGKTVEAGRQFSQARQMARGHITRILPFLSEEEQLQFLSVRDRAMFHVALDFALGNSDDSEIAERSSEWQLNGKSVSFSALAQRQRLNARATSAIQREKMQRLREVRQQIASREFSVFRRSGLDATALDNLVQLEQSLFKELARDSADRVVKSDWVSLPQVRSSLANGQLLVDFARVSVSHNSPNHKREFYAAWIIPPADMGDISVVNLGPASEIDPLIATLLEDIKASPALITASSEAAATEAIELTLQNLAVRILHPVLKVAGNFDHLILSPDAALWFVPWSALPVANGGPLVEHSAVQFVNSGRDLLTPPDPINQPQQPIIFANPDFDLKLADVEVATRAVLGTIALRNTAANNKDSRLPKVIQLPGTADEAALVKSSLESLCGKTPVLYLGKYAAEGVLRAVHSPQVLLLSTHGFFLPEMQATNVNPLVQSGLLLAGANDDTTGPSSDDGIVTALELLSLDLQGTDLVVLSACETGLGNLRNGEGVAGLRQAFQLAGANNVISTLWQIPDRESALIMNDFFAGLADKQTKANALRNAQIKHIAARRNRTGAAHPLFWAAWTTTGS